MDNIKLKVVYEHYARGESSTVAIGHITAPTFREAIIKMLSVIGMYLDEEGIKEREEELGREMTQEELIDELAMQNGDGCDYIMSLINETTGEIYMEAEDCFEHWSI